MRQLIWQERSLNTIYYVIVPIEGVEHSLCSSKFLSSAKIRKFIKGGHTLGITVETLSSQEKFDDQWLRYRPLVPINMGLPMKYSLYHHA